MVADAGLEEQEQVMWLLTGITTHITTGDAAADS